MYLWIVFLHVLGGFIFMLAHGVSAGVAFQLKREHDPERIRALLNLSTATGAGFVAGLLLLLLSGIVLGFLGRWWGKGWIWVSLAVLVAIVVVMSFFTGRHYNPLRKAVGLPYIQQGKPQPALEPAPQEEIERVVKLGRPGLLLLLGFGSWGLILWLMMFKPF